MGFQVYDHLQCHAGQIVALANAQRTHFQFAGERRGRAEQQILAGTNDVHLIIADQLCAPVDQTQGQIGFSRTGSAADQNASAIYSHGRGVHRLLPLVGCRGHSGAFGRRISKQAPACPPGRSRMRIVP